jgi:O-antigen/teichoic acid export membrane protein
MAAPIGDNPQDIRGRAGGASSAARHGSYRSGFAFGILSFLTVAIVSLVATIATSRIYGVRIIGQFALVSAPVAALWVLSTAKEQAALIKEITQLPPRHPRVTQLFSAVFTFSSTLTVAMSILGAFVSWLVFRGPLHHPELIAPTFVSLAGYAIVTNTGWNFDSIFSAFVAGHQLFWVRLHEAFSFLVFATIGGLVWHSVWGLVIGTIAGSLTALVHRVFLAHKFVRMRLSFSEYRIGLRALPDLLRFGLKITPGGMAQGVSQQAGVWAIAAVAPVSLVGAYSRAELIPNRLQQVNIRIVEVLYPTLVGRRARRDGEGFDRALIDSIRYGITGMLLIAAACGGAAHSFLELFGPGFSRASPALALLLLFPVMASITTTQTQGLWAVDRPGKTSIIQLTRLTVTIVLTVLLTPRIGITGPALALLTGYLVVVVWNTIALRPFLHRAMSTTWPLRERFALVAAYIAGFASAHLAEDAIPSLLGLILALAVGTVTYTAVVLAAGGFNSRDRHRLIETIDNARSRRDQRRAAAQTPAQSSTTSDDRVNDELPDLIAP